MTPLLQCQPTRAPAAHGPMSLCASNARPPSWLSKRNRRPHQRASRTGDSSRARLRVQAHARRAVRCRRALAASDAVLEVYVLRRTGSGSGTDLRKHVAFAKSAICTFVPSVDELIFQRRGF